MNLVTELLSHQREAVEKLSGLRVGALYMEMGTGKTRTTLSLIKPRLDAGKVDAVLWLCPCSVKKNLREDISYHCGEMPPEIIIRGIESLSSSDRLYLQLLRLVAEHRVFLVVDESNLVKNPFAIRTERITILSKSCPYRLILNGTPISRNESDLFAQWQILDWRILGYKSYYSFAANHLEYWTIRMPDGSERVDKDHVRRVLNVDYLVEKIAPYTFQCRKADCLPLPKKEYSSRSFFMTDEQERCYANVRERYLTAVDEFRDDTIYKLFTALQHVAAGRDVTSPPAKRMSTRPIFDKPEDNPRIRALLAELEDIGHEKAIIYCKYQAEVKEILSALPGAVEFTGRMSQTKRQAMRQAFLGDAQYMVTNKSCGAYGLNLQRCHNIIFYDNDFNLATRLQAEDRVHRLGQTHDVNIVDICAWSTIDKFISDCLLRKENLAEAFKREITNKKEE